MTPNAAEHCERPIIVTEQLVWQGRTLRIEFDPDWSGEEDPDFQIAHLEVFVEAPVKAPIPVTETGYRSHFVGPRFVLAAGGPAAFVRVWLDQEAKSRQWLRMDERWRQFDLFD